MSQRVASQLFLVAAASGAVLVLSAACSTFSESDSPTAPTEEAGADGPVPEEGGGLDAAAADGADASADCPTCVVVASTDTSTIVDVRVAGTNVLWATTAGLPWSAAPGNVFYAPQTGSQAAVSKVFSIDVPLGSLGGSEKPGQAFVSLVSASAPTIQALVEHSGTPSATPIPPKVGPLTIRLVESGGSLYWLSRGDSQTTFLSWSETASDSDTVAIGPGTLFDLAISEVDSLGTVAFVAGPTSISMVVTRSGKGFSPLLQNSKLTSLATSAMGLYWGTSDGLVQFCPVDATVATAPNCTPSNVLVVNDVIANVIVSGNDLFAATASGSIYRCPLTGCADGAKPIVSGAPLFDADEYLHGHTLAATSTALFWSEGGHKQPHRIVRLPL